MSKWEPEDYVDDPMANAMLNVAASLDRLATATNELLYGLKYSKHNGMSVAEALENAGEAIQGGLSEVARELSEIREVDVVVRGHQKTIGGVPASVEAYVRGPEHEMDVDGIPTRSA